MKYLLYIATALFLVFFTLNYFNNESRKKHKENAKRLTGQTETDKKIIKSLQSDINALYASKQKTDTIIKYIKGETIVIYKPSEGISAGESEGIKTLNDSITKDGITINYVAKYIGQIYSIGFNWTIPDKIVHINHIVVDSVPYPVEKKIPTYKSSFLIGAQINTLDALNPYISILWVNKKKVSVNASMGLRDRNYMIGIYYRIY